MSASVKAVIDIGSNSIKLRVGRRKEGGPPEILLDTTEVAQLGKGMVGGRLDEGRMEKALGVVARMAALAREMGVDSPFLVGTMALRMASNAGEFLRRAREATGLDVRVLSGEEEARYSWKGALSAMARLQNFEGREVVMFDTGGGSTEFVFGRDGQPGRIQSLPVGAVSLTEEFLGLGPVRQTSLEAAACHVSGLLREYGVTPSHSGAPAVIGTGGGVVAMASVKGGRENFIPTALHGVRLTRRDVRAQIHLYSLLTLEERQNVVGLPPSRADVVLGSACIVLSTLLALNAPFCTLSVNGLRHGVLLELLGL